MNPVDALVKSLAREQIMAWLFAGACFLGGGILALAVQLNVLRPLGGQFVPAAAQWPVSIGRKVTALLLSGFRPSRKPWPIRPRLPTRPRSFDSFATSRELYSNRNREIS